MANLIEDWRKRNPANKEANKKLIKRLSKQNDKKLNLLADDLHNIAFEKIDCLDCANCCKSIPPILNDNDINRMAKHLGMKVSAFETTYIKTDGDGDRVMNQSPCTFLENDNRCRIYEARPKACREYPHTNNFEFLKNQKLHAINAEYCPAVFFILNEMRNKQQNT
jgi:Fe-S-cluster containining protein